MNALKNNKHIEAFVAQFNDDVHKDSDPEGQDAIDDLVAHVLDISDGPDDAVMEPNGPHDDVQDNVQIFFHNLSDCAVIHTLTHHIPSASRETRYDHEKFRGILVDTGAARGNTSSLKQYLAYCNHIGCSPTIDGSKAATCYFGNGSERSQGVASISFPLGALTITFYAHILRDAVVPLLICIDEMVRWGLYFNNIANRLVHSPTGQYLSVLREGAHPFIMWNPVINCHYSTSELRQLHRRFGHPHTDKLLQLLRKADLDHVTEQTRTTLEKIVRSCKLCQLFAARPRRFKFTLRDDAQFNSTVYVDPFWID